MMQQIAPLQTDIAAKSTLDVSPDVDKQLLGSDNQQKRFGSGEEFGRALEQHKQESKKSNDDLRSNKENTSSSKSDNETPDSSDGSKDSLIDDSNNSGSESNSSDSQIRDSKAAVESKVSTDNSKNDVLNDEVQLNKKLVEAAQPTEISVADEADAVINWVALVEEVKSLNAASTKVVQTPSEENMPVWDGEIADMIAIDDNALIIKKTDLKPTFTIELPPVQKDAMVSGDPAKIVEVAESILSKLQTSQLEQTGDGADSKTIPNDLFTKPIEVVNAESLVEGKENSIETQAILVNAGLTNTDNKPLVDVTGVTDVAKTEPDSLLSALMVDLVTKSDKEIKTDGAESRLSSEVLPENTELKIEPIEQTLISGVALGSPSDTIIEKPVIKLDASDNNALRSMLKLDAEQQKLVFDDIASQVNKLSSEPMTNSQQNNFIAALKAGVEEFSKQLQQGREPGISIKALIAEAMGTADVTPESGTAQQIASQLSQISSQLSQTLTLADALRNNLNDPTINAAHNLRTEAGTSELSTLAESNKQSQLSQILDKPANILKSDGQNQFAEKIRWIVNARNSFAEIRLDPPDLGTVQVKVSTAGEAATVSFVVQSQQARDALDQAAPRLREMLAQQGIELGQSSVQQESQQQQEQQQGGEFAGHKGDDGMEEVAADVIEQRATGGVAGGIDFYA